MARRNRDLAGLAALGALGYMATRGKDVPVEDRGSSRQEISLEELARGSRDLEGGITPQGLDESGQRIRELEPPPVRPVATRPAATTNRSMASSKVPEEVPSRGRRELPARRNVAGDYTRKMGATAEEIEAYRNRPSATRSADKRPDLSTPEGRKRAEQEQALERVTPEEMLIGGPGLKALHGAAKKLADRPARQLLLPAPAARPPVRGAGEGFVMYKKGGAVKAKKMASGGSTSSASSRADGIASRGKTKCKMY